MIGSRLLATAQQLERIADKPLTPNRAALRVLAAHFREQASRRREELPELAELPGR